MTSLVLVHGSWHTGDSWGDVVDGLSALGHDTVTPTMPGHAKDADRIGVRFEDYAATLSGVLENQSDPVVLVGHSSAGVLLQTIAAKHADKISKLVFLNAFVVSENSMLIDLVPPEIAEQFRAAAASSSDNSIPVDESFFRNVLLTGIPGEEQTRIVGQMVPQPFDYYCQTIDHEAFARCAIPMVYVYATDDLSLPENGYRHMAGGLPDCELISITGGHEPMFTNPNGLARVLSDILVSVK